MHRATSVWYAKKRIWRYASLVQNERKELQWDAEGFIKKLRLYCPRLEAGEYKKFEIKARKIFCAFKDAYKLGLVKGLTPHARVIKTSQGCVHVHADFQDGEDVYRIKFCPLFTPNRRMFSRVWDEVVAVAIAYEAETVYGVGFFRKRLQIYPFSISVSEKERLLDEIEDFLRERRNKIEEIEVIKWEK